MMKRIINAGFILTAIFCLAMFGACALIFNSNGEGGMTGVPRDVLLQIRQDYFNQVVRPVDDSVNFRQVRIEKHFGVFNGFHVVMFEVIFVMPGMCVFVEIGDVEICAHELNRIFVWKPGYLMSLELAFENGSLSNADIQIIASFMRHLPH